VGSEVLDLTLAAEVVPAARLLPSSWLAILQAEDEGLGLVERVVDRAGSESALAARLREIGALVPEAQVRLMAPIPRPGLMLSCGTNYRAHLAEFNAAQPSRPGAFIKYSGAVIGPGDTIVLPRAYPDLVDYEAEFCFVFGRPCHQVSEAGALDYVLGYTLTNDVSARNWAMDVGKATNATEANQAVMSNTLGKSFPTFAPLGPTIVTKDEMPDPHAVKFQSVLDGQVMQNGDTSDFIFSIPWLIAEYSKHFQFKPGDVVTTGSPPGVGLARKPPVLLRDGSVIEIRSEKIGSLSNPVVAG
jgi:2-keto-4-pentenoate hydratase/2-oxohepta-3-ene-1,7-dioic acid hydratase in catechol pathway